MKSFNKVLGTIKRKPTNGGGANADNYAAQPSGTESVEAAATRSVKKFCESGNNTSGDEVTYLPTIVESAESSPAAAAECARLIRKYLHKDYWTGPSYQYNAIMLMRILADNPGMTFTRNMAEKKFVDAVKELLRNGRDHSVRQMLMETLDSFEAEKGYDEGLAGLIVMWRKEKEKAYRVYGGHRPPLPVMPRSYSMPPMQPQPNPHSQNYSSRGHSDSRRLPNPVELANRLEEARTSAKLLTQVVENTPPAEILHNELIKEFADRCLAASRSIQGYMSSQNPAPDNDTMESLIDTNEQLQQALNLHQRAVLGARKQENLRNEERERARNGDGGGNYGAPVPADRPATKPTPPLPSRDTKADKGKGTAGGGGSSSQNLTAYGASSSAAAGPSRSANVTPRPEEDPFRDPPTEQGWRAGVGTGGGSSGAAGTGLPATAGGDDAGVDDGPRLAYEPYHPGFSSTPSYLNRQESAAGKVHMHGASPPSGADVSPVESPVRTRRESGDAAFDRADAAAADQPGGSGRGGGSSNGKAPMYRY